MKRRDFSIQLAGAGLALAAAGTARAQGGPVEGQHYVRLSTPAPVNLPAGKQVEVLEFFWYECPHCRTFDPLLDAWQRRLPADVAFRHVPVGFTARHLATAKLYYALEAIGQREALHKRIFDAIHLQNRRLTTEAQIVDFVKANGVDGDKFSAAYKSFSVATQANRAQQITNAYKIDGVPAIGIQGRYYTSASLAGGYERALAVTDFLIQRARQG